MFIDAKKLDYKSLNKAIKKSEGDCVVNSCLGQRFIACGMSKKNITINGVPGNALGAYLNGARIEVNGNAQDAVADTMNAGEIIIHGNAGDAAGYSMRGGEIYIKGNAGYRAGIHMKAYEEKFPVMVIGKKAGSFLGEYQAGGLIIVLGIGLDGSDIVGNNICTGMHGGKMFIRSDCSGIVFPSKVTVNLASDEQKTEIRKYVSKFCKYFNYDIESIMNSEFTAITPDNKNPYRQMYVIN